jgi:hypothetical protein
MDCPNCKRHTKTKTSKGVLRYRNKYGKEIPVPRWGEWCLECGHKFYTPEQEEMHKREAKRLIEKTEGPK